MKRKLDGKTKHPLYETWGAIIERCNYPRHPRYHRYGGRGIRICERWRNDFWAFVADLPPRPSSAHTLGRLDNDGDYEPGNMEWQTPFEQARNRHDNRLITARGKTMCTSDWAAELGIAPDTLRRRLRSGWELEAALSKPVQRRRVDTGQRLARAR